MLFSVIFKDKDKAVIREVVETESGTKPGVEFALSWSEVNRFFTRVDSKLLLEMKFPTALEAGLFSLVPVYNRARSYRTNESQRLLGFLVRKLSQSTNLEPKIVIEKFDQYYQQTFGGQNA